MFWRKRKPDIIDSPSDLLGLAERLGVERRLNVRVRYPRGARLCKLPGVRFQGSDLRVQDISVGGCCILDPYEILGSEIGQDIELEMRWMTGDEKVRARIVARVDHRRHIQFNELSAQRQNQLRKYMVSGVRGASLRKHLNPDPSGPGLAAAEIWSSLHGDTVTLENDLHRMAQVHLNAESFLFLKESWPIKESNSQMCSKIEFEQIILFLANIPYPSEKLSALMTSCEELLDRGRPGDRE